MIISTRETVFANLEQAIKDIAQAETYQVKFETVTRNDLNIAAADKGVFPLIGIVDTGPEVIMEKDNTGIRYRTDFTLVGYIQSANLADLQNKVNQLISTLRQFVNSSPDLGTNVLAIWDIELSDRLHEIETQKAGFALACQMVWYAPHSQY